MKKCLFQTARMARNNGFTLVEMLVVLAIMAILIAVAVPTMTGALQDAKDKSTLSDARAAYIAYKLIYDDMSASGKGAPIQKLKEYIGRTDDDKVMMATAFMGYGANLKFTWFYTDSRLNDKFVIIEMGQKATIEKGNLRDYLITTFKVPARIVDEMITKGFVINIV